MAATRKTASTTKRTAGRRRGTSDTRTRIVDCSISLFNRHGLQNVAIEQIAAELKISPGNLTYHFKRKRDLIQATLEALHERMKLALERPVAVRNADEGAEYLIRVFKAFWEFRFFFNALTYLLTSDRELRKQFFAMRDWVLQIMVNDLNYMRESGIFLAPIAPNSYQLLAENIWSQLLHWLRMQQIQSPLAVTPSNAALYDCAEHIWSLNQHWLEPKFAPALLKAFQKLLLNNSPPKSAGHR